MRRKKVRVRQPLETLQETEKRTMLRTTSEVHRMTNRISNHIVEQGGQDDFLFDTDDGHDYSGHDYGRDPDNCVKMSPRITQNSKISTRRFIFKGSGKNKAMRKIEQLGKLFLYRENMTMRSCGQGQSFLGTLLYLRTHQTKLQPSSTMESNLANGD
ncbi:hypothetical protein GOBAR_DD12419 [Gossypium barbadense]|nr:hypothetical protein GOBAR_DD12419 [Gossypium barbadense]